MQGQVGKEMVEDEVHKRSLVARRLKKQKTWMQWKHVMHC